MMKMCNFSKTHLNPGRNRDRMVRPAVLFYFPYCLTALRPRIILVYVFSTVFIFPKHMDDSPQAFLTPEKFEELKAELETLKIVRRKEIAESLEHVIQIKCS